MDFESQKDLTEGMQEKIEKSFAGELSKGCDVNISSFSLDIKPRFDEYALANFSTKKITVQKPKPDKKQDRAYLLMWFSTLDEVFWQEFELALKELGAIKGRISLLLVGNTERISCEIGVLRKDEIALCNIINTKFPNIQIDINSESCFLHYLKEKNDLSWDIRDFVAPKNYWHPSINYEALKKTNTPLMTIYSTLTSLPKNEIGFYQVVFEKMNDEWRTNILNLIEGEFETSKYATIRQPLLQSSGIGSEDYREARKKLIGPYFAVSIRVGAFCVKERLRGVIESLSLVITSIQYCNREFSYLSKKNYLKLINKEEIIHMIASGEVRRQGMILTVGELAPLYNFASKEVLQRQDWHIDKAVGFKASEQFLKEDGVVIGVNEFAGKKTIIRQPESIRNLHTSIGGLIGMGKSYLMENMVLHDINNGCGIGILDPHGDLIERIIKQIPSHRIDDCIYFSPCEDDLAVCYNAFELNPGEDIGKRVDDLVVAVRSLYPANAWGTSIESVLMSVFWTLLKAKNTCLADVGILLSKTEEGYAMREQLTPLIDNRMVKMFWEDTFETLPQATVNRVLNKLSMFLLPDKINRIFSQRENKIDFKKIIDEKKIFLGYLPAGRIGSDCTDTLGSNLVSGFYNAGMSRQDQTRIPPHMRVPFNLYIDEFARFSVKSFSDCLRELRKYEVRLILAYQQKASLSESIRLALGNVGTIIVLDCDWNDAQTIYKDFYGEVEHKNLMRKGQRRGLINMKGDIASFITIECPKNLKGDGENVKQLSIQKYYTQIKKQDIQVKKKQQKKSVKRKNRKVHYDEIE